MQLLLLQGSLSLGAPWRSEPRGVLNRDGPALRLGEGPGRRCEWLVNAYAPQCIHLKRLQLVVPVSSSLLVSLHAIIPLSSRRPTGSPS